eukprot:6295572-Pyramimonas_sp.AAC.1
MHEFGLGMGQPMDFNEFVNGVTDEHMREWLSSDRLYGHGATKAVHMTDPLPLGLALSGPRSYMYTPFLPRQEGVA